MVARIGSDHPGVRLAELHLPRVCYTYQPDLTSAWFDCMATFRREHTIDSLLSQSIFWVVTEARRSFYFYCMGHREMSLAAAGLEDRHIQTVTQILASDWSVLNASDRAVREVARRSATNPTSVTAEEIRQLEEFLGPAKAKAALWWIAACHYLACTSQPFEFPLEQGNPMVKIGAGGNPASASPPEPARHFFAEHLVCLVPHTFRRCHAPRQSAPWPELLEKPYSFSTSAHLGLCAIPPNAAIIRRSKAWIRVVKV
jgi:hypothetical protein